MPKITKLRGVHWKGLSSSRVRPQVRLMGTEVVYHSMFKHPLYPPPLTSSYRSTQHYISIATCALWDRCDKTSPHTLVCWSNCDICQGKHHSFSLSPLNCSWTHHVISIRERDKSTECRLSAVHTLSLVIASLFSLQEKHNRSKLFILMPNTQTSHFTETAAALSATDRTNERKCMRGTLVRLRAKMAVSVSSSFIYVSLARSQPRQCS